MSEMGGRYKRTLPCRSVHRSAVSTTDQRSARVHELGPVERAEIAHGQPVSAAFIRPGSGSGPEPRRDLLDQPRVVIGIGEARERPVAGALRVRARLPRLDRERRAVPDGAHLDATADELVIGGLDVGDDQFPLGRAWRGRRESLAERDRGPRARGCELDDTKAFHRGDVAVEAPTQALIELRVPIY